MTPLHRRLAPYLLVPLVMLFLVACGGRNAAQTQVTAQLANSTVIPSDRNLIVNYIQGKPEETKLLLVNANNGEAIEWQLQGHRLNDPKAPCSSSPLFRGLSWSSKRQQLLFASDLDCQYGDYLIDKNGAVSNLSIPTLKYPQRPITVDSPRLSPNGTTVAYLDTDFKTGKGIHNVYLFDISSKKSRQVTSFSDKEVTSLKTVNWSPYEGFLVFAGLDSQKVLTVWQVKRNGSGLTMLLRDSTAHPFKLPVEAIENYKLSPDERFLAFLAPTNGNEKAVPTLWVLDLTTKAVRQLLEPAKELHRAVNAFDWSPNGTQLVVSAGFDTKSSCSSGFFSFQFRQVCKTNTTLYLINSDGSKLARLTQLETSQDARNTLQWLSR